MNVTIKSYQDTIEMLDTANKEHVNKSQPKTTVENTAKITQLKAECQKMKTERDSAIMQIAKFDSENKKLTTKNTELQKEYTNLKTNFDTKINEIKDESKKEFIKQVKFF